MEINITCQNCGSSLNAFLPSTFKEKYIDLLCPYCNNKININREGVLEMSHSEVSDPDYENVGFQLLLEAQS